MVRQRKVPEDSLILNPNLSGFRLIWIQKGQDSTKTRAKLTNVHPAIKCIMCRTKTGRKLRNCSGSRIILDLVNLDPEASREARK